MLEKKKTISKCDLAQTQRCNCYINPFPNDLDSSKLKELADDNFEFDENGRKLSIKVEKHCGKRRNCS